MVSRRFIENTVEGLVHEELGITEENKDNLVDLLKQQLKEDMNVRKWSDLRFSDEGLSKHVLNFIFPIGRFATTF